MWKKQLQISTRISSILSRAITSKDSSSSVSNSHNYSSSIFFSSSCLLGRTEGKPFPSAGGLYFRNPGGIFTRGSFADLFVKNDNFYCSQSKSAERFHCWNCGAEAESATPFLFCRACRSVQSVDESIDYFQIFGLGRKYKIEVEELEKKYKDWQKMLHPDLVHSKSQREREYAAEQSARVIDAYRTLTDPLLRAIYIVKLEGILVDEEERITDPELLAEVMELREAVDEAEDSRALNEIQAQLQEKLRYWSDAFDDAYVRGNYEDALASIRRMTYYRRANEEIVKKL
ncbi:iron-sulfur cluster co-chaperone protein HscB, mitochondrial isoform X1 [Sesamum indicum]|uniref:Iron-sulfur cluster co-chaperone protein HscB, mitochondrial isoform X1 n=1 Tax=Sesamum indicum TaxID=4182 RepID=A0A6I9U9C5_SESIN|nr:iron-sulfur cluster co-chaperone protein HscB, mitochondrial isoform X1 [Sesamum indicum]